MGEVVGSDEGDRSLLGITAFVPFSAIGELVSARVLEHKKRYLNAELIGIERSSFDRTEPKCKYFTSCGGCELQHITYEGQLQAKLDMLRGALKAQQFASDVIDKVQPLVPSASYGYRRRITLHVDASGKIGFYRGGSRSVVVVESCPISTPEISSLLENLQPFGREIKGKLSSILLEADDDGVVAVLRSPYDLAEAEMQTVLAAAKKHFENVVLLVGDKEVGGFGRQILELPLGEPPRVQFRVPAGYFSQVNWEINRELVANVVALSGAKAGRKILDLYAGAGNFSLPLARAGARVSAVECDKRLVMFGRENAQQNGLEKNLEFIETTVEKHLKTLRPKKVDVLLADPPRSGLGKLVSSLDFASKLLLISCHPPSFVRDLKNLLSEGWSVNTIRPFDMFAQTSYVEILAVLERE